MSTWDRHMKAECGGKCFYCKRGGIRAKVEESPRDPAKMRALARQRVLAAMGRALVQGRLTGR